MKRFLHYFLLGLSACGNYSNEDLDFQLALPQDGELEAKMPQAISVDDSAEYYVTTRKVVTDFNAIARTLVGLVDKVRGFSPTSRHGSQRIWGPWADDKHPGWQIRVLMDRVDDPNAASGFNISYNLQVHNTQAVGTDFIDFMTGFYAPSGNARRGRGELQLWVDRVRQADFPVEDFDQLNKLELCYQTFEYPIVVHMFAQNRTATEREITYDYQEAADGSGTLFFNLTTDGTADAIDLRFISRWLGSGAGRADAYAVNRNNLLAGTDCWGPDTRAAMSWRWPAEKSSDEPSLCAFSAPTELSAPTCGP